jgi:hypothetical protein
VGRWDPLIDSRVTSSLSLSLFQASFFLALHEALHSAHSVPSISRVLALVQLEKDLSVTFDC